MNKPIIFRLTNNLHLGGVQKRIAELLPMIENEFEPHIATYRQRGFLYDIMPQKGITTHFIPIHGKLHPPSIFRLARFWRKKKAAIVHTHSLGANIPGILSAAIAKTPVRIAQVHRKNYHWYASTALQRQKHIAIESLIHRMFTNKVLFVSQESLNYFQKKSGLPSNKLKVLHNGIEIPRKKMPPKEAREQKKLPQDRTIIGFVGRISKGKGLDFFLETAQRCLQEKPDLLFLIIGDGPSRAEHEKKVLATGLETNIWFVGEQSNLNAWYPALDLLLFTSEPGAEGMPGVVLEACAHNLPILARYSAPIAEIQQYYFRICFLSEENDAYKDVQKALALPAADLIQFENEFSIQSMAKRTKELYRKCLTNS